MSDRQTKDETTKIDEFFKEGRQPTRCPPRYASGVRVTAYTDAFAMFAFGANPLKFETNGSTTHA